MLLESIPAWKPVDDLRLDTVIGFGSGHLRSAVAPLSMAELLARYRRHSVPWRASTSSDFAMQEIYA